VPIVVDVKLGRLDVATLLRGNPSRITQSG